MPQKLVRFRGLNAHSFLPAARSQGAQTLSRTLQRIREAGLDAETPNPCVKIIESFP